MKTTIGSSLEVRLEPGEGLNVARSRTVSCEGAIKRKSLLAPQLDCALARAFNGLLFVRQIFTRESSGTLTLSCAHGRRLVRIDLAVDETVGIQLSNVIAMSTSVKVRSRLALSGAAIAANCVFVKELYCPAPGTKGIIVLETEGEPVAAKGSAMTFDITRMIAWDSSAKFSTEPLETIGCVVFEPMCISVVSTGEEECCVLLDADDGVAEMGFRGVARQLLALVIPGV